MKIRCLNEATPINPALYTQADKTMRQVRKTAHSSTGKDLESVVGGALQFAAMELGLKIKAQQPVRNNDGKLYLIDFYFPDLKLGVECDEDYHSQLDQADRDAARSQDIVDLMNIELRRVNAHSNYKVFRDDLRRIINEIQTIKTNNNLSDYDYEDIEDSRIEKLLAYILNNNSFNNPFITKWKDSILCDSDIPNVQIGIVPVTYDRTNGETGYRKVFRVDLNVDKENLDKLLTNQNLFKKIKNFKKATTSGTYGYDDKTQPFSIYISRASDNEQEIFKQIVSSMKETEKIAKTIL